MVELVFVVCLITAPDRCEERSWLGMPGVKPLACMMEAQPLIAAWSQTHVGWRVARWFCRDAADRETAA